MADALHTIMTCKECRKPEYFGMMHWSLNKRLVCRACIHSEWEQTRPGWKRTNADYEYPYYSDGKDYRESII